jgi:hypothetical protein
VALYSYLSAQSVSTLVNKATAFDGNLFGVRSLIRPESRADCACVVAQFRLNQLEAIYISGVCVLS